MLADILTRAAAIPVQQVTDGMLIERDHVYVIPPDREMTILKGMLHLAPRTPEVPHRPLDNFFRSLANDQESRAIGVVLSGNDADGSVGLQAIRDAGGITFAQNAESAKFDVMPRAAAGAADLVLPPREIAQQLVACSADESRNEADVVPRFGEEAEHSNASSLLRQQYRQFPSHSNPAFRAFLRRVLLEDLPSYSYADFCRAALSSTPLYRDLHRVTSSFANRTAML